MTDLAVEVVNLTKVYNAGKPTEVRALNEASYEVTRGSITGLLGPNGAGKTTSLEIIEGIRTSTSGSVTVLGRAVRGRDPVLYDRLGIQFQHSAYFDRLRVRELAELFGSFYSRSVEATALLDTVNLGHRANSYARQLSGGEAQRLSLAMAIVNEPDLLVLDEPTSGLDPVARHDVWSVIRRVNAAGTTVFLSTHNMVEAETLCHDVVMLRAGQVIAYGGPTDLARMHGLPLTVRFRCGRGAWSEGRASRFAESVSRSENGEDDLWELRVRQEGDTLTDLMAEITAIPSGVSGFDVSRASLEDVFVALAR